MPRFVILRHEPPAPAALHWDLMFETGDVLRTWALTAVPAAGRSCDAKPLADHRLRYLDYCGPLTGDRGQVKQWDVGTYTVEESSNAVWQAHLKGQRLQGAVRLVRQTSQPLLWRAEFFGDVAVDP